MKRMCKFIFGIIFSIFMMGIISCSGQDESTNLTIAIDMSGLLPSNESKDGFARSVDDEKWKLEVTLIDLEDENNILPLTISVPIIDNKASVTFEKIPLFFKGRIEAIIFEGETPKFTGKSEEFIVHEGRNRISVHMEEVDNPGAPVDPEDPTDPADPDDPNQPGDGTGEGSGDTGGDAPTEPDDPEDPADPNDPNQPGDGTGEGSGETGGNEPTDPGNPEEPDDPTEPGNPGDDPEIGETEKTAKYTVKHYQEKLDHVFTYEIYEEEEKEGTIGEQTTVTAKEYEGFTEREFEQAKIAADGSTEIKIYYDRNRVELIFDTDGGSSVESIIGRYGATVVAPENPTKNGYIFTAWNPTLPKTFPSTDSGYKATWTKEGDYTITYNLDGGTNADENPISYNVETETITLKEPTKIGYSFEGWYKGEEKITQITKGSTGNITLTAVWKANTDTVYTLEHWQQNAEDDGYTLYLTEEKNGTTGTQTTVTAKEYEGFTVREFEQAKIAADGSTEIKIYYDRNRVELIFDTDGGSSVESIIGRYGATVVAPENPTKNGYTFTAWNPTLPETFPSADSEYKATWIKEGDYTITYNLDGGTNANENPISYNVETETITLKEPTKIGYSFEGWYKGEEGTTITEITKGSTGNITLTAVWKANTYTVVFNPGVDDGSVRETMDSLPCTYDVPNVLPKNEFTRENFDFNGWKDAYGIEYKDCASVENLSSTQNAVVTLYAQWHSQSQVKSVDFSVAGGDVNYGTKVTLSCETAGATIYYKEGNAEVFSEYNGEIEIKNDVTITAYATKEGMVDADYITKTFTLKKYTVTLNYNNETEETTVEVTSGSQYTLPTEVTRTGYTFGGWELNGAIVEEQTITVTDSDITLTAKWTPITYTVVFKPNEGDVLPFEQSQTFTYDKLENLNENVFTREGYTFVRWNTQQDGSGTSYTDEQEVKNLASTEDAVVTLYAQWEKIESTIEIEFNGYSDILLDEDSVRNDGSTITITIPNGYSVVAWEKDGVTIEGSEGKESITVSEWDGGIYTVTIIFTDGAGNFYSYEMQVTINKVNRAN